MESFKLVILKYLRNYLTLFIILFCFSITGQTQRLIIRGVYFSDIDKNYRVVVSKRRFVYLNNSDTIAICNYNIISNGFLEIFNEHPIEKVKRNISVGKNSQKGECITLSFHIPCDYPLRITLQDSYGHILSYETRTNKSFSFPNELFQDSLFVSVEPCHLSDVTLPEYDYQGVTYLEKILSIKLYPNTQYDIIIPNLTNTVWSRFYIPSCFIKVEHNKIIWNTEDYIRSNISFISLAESFINLFP